MTLFAPTDAAFEALDMDFLTSSFLGMEPLKTFFWHFMDGVLMSEEFYDGLTLNTGGGDLTMEVDNGVVTVNNATVVVADIEASNGVIHIIDAVLDLGCSDPEACNYNPDAWSGTATCVYAENCDFCLDGVVVDGDADDDECAMKMKSWVAWIHRLGISIRKPRILMQRLVFTCQAVARALGMTIGMRSVWACILPKWS